MTIQNTTGKVSVNGNGSATSFSFAPMVIFEDTDLTVTLVDTTGVETLLTEGTGATNYAVVVASYPGSGSITYPASGTTKLAVGQSLVMKPVLPLTQTMALSTQGPYDPTLQETAFDRQTVIAQQHQEQLDRSVTLPIGVTGVSTTLPVPVANTVLAWASDALSLINVGIASIGQTVASAFSLTLFLLSTAAAWRTALGSTTVGDAVFVAANAAAARTAIGAGTVTSVADATNGGITVTSGTGAATLKIAPGDLPTKATPVLADIVVLGDSASSNAGARATLQAIRTGSVAQVVSSETAAVATGTTVTPIDDTIPQNTEGDQYLSLSITPKSATSTLLIEVCGVVSFATARTGTIALFQDATAGALAAVPVDTAGSTEATNFTLRHKMAAGTTSATTFNVRIGPASAGTTTFNGSSGARLYGGAAASSITITEILP